MGWGLLASAFSDLPALTERNDDDIYDRMSHRWTAGTMILFAILVSTKQYVGDPIACWVPVHFSGAWEDYTNSFCWIRNTYWLAWDERIPKDYESRRKTPIIYYQWVPLILMVQALLFYMPIVIWRNMNTKTGIDLNDIVESAERYQKADDLDVKKKILYFLTKQTHRYLGITKKEEKKPEQVHFLKRMMKLCCTPCCGKRLGNYMTWLYLLVKIIFLANVIGQLWMLNKFLGQNYTYYGIEVIQAMANGSDWSESPRFPRVTLCDLDVRRLGNLHRYTVQCVLTINFFNEKMYLFIWFWMLLVAIITVIGIVLLVLRMALSQDRHRYVQGHLIAGSTELFNPKCEGDRKLVTKFVENYLRQDGVLVLRLVGHNTNKVTVTEFMCALWAHYKELPKNKKMLENENLLNNDESNV